MPKRTLFIILLILILTGVITVTGLYIGKKLARPQEEPIIPPSIESEEIAPKITPTEPSEIDISSWKTYRDEKYRYEIRYPAGWIVESKNTNMTVFSPSKLEGKYEQPFIEINVKSNPQNLSIREFYNGINDRDLFSQTNNRYTTGEIAGRKYFKFVPYITFAGKVVVVIPLNSTFLEITDFGSKYQENRVFDTMISTLKFFN